VFDRKGVLKIHSGSPFLLSDILRGPSIFFEGFRKADLKEPLIKFGLDFSGDKMFRFKAQITENSPLFSRFATQKRSIFALKKQFTT